MPQTNKIVCFYGDSAERRKFISGHVPPGFELVFVDYHDEVKAVAAVADADFILGTRVPTKVVQAATKARLIQKIGEGTDKIDVALATQMGIPVAKTSGSASAAVAELATLLMLAVMRRLPQAHNSMLEGKWLHWELRPGAQTLRSKQVGIIGLGKIGKLVAEQMRGFRASVVYYNRVRQPESEEARLGARFLPLDELLRTSDVVSVHVPLNASTLGLIGARELALMKPTAIIVNTCRGGVIDEDALYEVLKEKRIRGAGIDDWVKEPPGPNHPFYSLDNVVLSPHLGGGTDDSEIAGVVHAFANIVKVASGEPLDPADLATVSR